MSFRQKMKILYIGNIKHEFIDFPDTYIKNSLEKMGHEVIGFDENEFDMEKILSYEGKVDLLFFHKGGVNLTEESYFQMSLTRLEILLRGFTCKKVCWFLDKIVSYAGEYIRRIEPMCDYVFVNDDTWLRAFETDKIFSLHCGIEKETRGVFKKELEGDIAYIGKVYGTREIFVNEFKKRYGKRFKVYDNIWGKDFDNLISSVKIIVSASYPFDDFYWSDSIYRVLGACGFLIYPRLEGIKEEGFVNGSHLIMYGNTTELISALNYWLDNDKDRKKIARQGQNFVSTNFTYKKRLLEIFNKLI